MEDSSAKKLEKEYSEAVNSYQEYKEAFKNIDANSYRGQELLDVVQILVDLNEMQTLEEKDKKRICAVEGDSLILTKKGQDFVRKAVKTAMTYDSYNTKHVLLGSNIDNEKKITTKVDKLFLPKIAGIYGLIIENIKKDIERQQQQDAYHMDLFGEGKTIQNSEAQQNTKKRNKKNDVHCTCSIF